MEMNLTFSAIQRQYDTNQELRRRVQPRSTCPAQDHGRSTPLHRGRASHRVKAGAPPNKSTNKPTAMPPGIAEKTNSEETAVASELWRVLMNRQPNADMDAPSNVRYWEKADRARTYQYVR